ATMEMERDIEKMTLKEYLSGLQNSTYGFTSQFFDQSPHIPNPPLDEKDLSLEEILGDFFRIGAENLRRKEQEEVQNVCDDKKFRDTDQEDSDQSP
ncbi:hypothetical protein Tco_0401606, partial [Tanacetum coccineum]